MDTTPNKPTAGIPATPSSTEATISSNSSPESPLANVLRHLLLQWPKNENSRKTIYMLLDNTIEEMSEVLDTVRKVGKDQVKAVVEGLKRLEQTRPDEVESLLDQTFGPVPEGGPNTLKRKLFTNTPSPGRTTDSTKRRRKAAEPDSSRCPFCLEPYQQRNRLIGHIRGHLNELCPSIEITPTDLQDRLLLGCGFCRHDRFYKHHNVAFYGPKALAEHIAKLHDKQPLLFGWCIVNSMNNILKHRTYDGCFMNIRSGSSTQSLSWTANENAKTLLRNLEVLGGRLKDVTENNMDPDDRDGDAMIDLLKNVYASRTIYDLGSDPFVSINGQPGSSTNRSSFNPPLGFDPTHPNMLDDLSQSQPLVGNSDYDSIALS